MRAFSYYVPTEVAFGTYSTEKVGTLANKYGATRVLVVYGGGSAKKSGLLDNVCSQLKEQKIEFECFGGVQPNPRLAFARLGVEKAIEMKADFILAIGGGSSIDTAKAIAIGANNPTVDIWEYWMKTQTPKASLPVGVVLSIPAAGSETSDSAVLTNEEDNEKRGLSGEFNRPAFAVMDPSLCATLPKFHLGCGVTDIMMHTLDRYFNPLSDNEFSDEVAEALLRVVIRHGLTAVENPSDLQSMSEIMWCGSISHNGLTGLGNVKDFAPHQLGHPISAVFDLAHGASLACVWASYARYVCKSNMARFARYARTVWNVSPRFTEEEAVYMGIDATENYFRSLGMAVGLTGAVGQLSDGELDALAYLCSFKKTRTIGTLKVLDHDDIRSIYSMANNVN